MGGTQSRRLALFAGSFALSSCGIAQSSERDPHAGDSSSGSSGGDGAATGGVSSEGGYTGCFTTFGLDPHLELAALSAEQKEIVCKTHEATYYCVNPEDQLELYESALLSLSADDPVSACEEFQSEFASGARRTVVRFECLAFVTPVCRGTVGELETCFRDHMQELEDRPTPEWSCEEASAVVDWTLLQAIDLPPSCASFDGCTL